MREAERSPERYVYTYVRKLIDLSSSFCRLLPASDSTLFFYFASKRRDGKICYTAVKIQTGLAGYIYAKVCLRIRLYAWTSLVFIAFLLFFLHRDMFAFATSVKLILRVLSLASLQRLIYRCMSGSATRMQIIDWNF